MSIISSEIKRTMLNAKKITKQLGYEISYDEPFRFVIRKQDRQLKIFCHPNCYVIDYVYRFVINEHNLKKFLLNSEKILLHRIQLAIRSIKNNEIRYIFNSISNKNLLSECMRDTCMIKETKEQEDAMAKDNYFFYFLISNDEKFKLKYDVLPDEILLFLLFKLNKTFFLDTVIIINKNSINVEIYGENKKLYCKKSINRSRLTKEFVIDLINRLRYEIIYDLI